MSTVWSEKLQLLALLNFRLATEAMVTNASMPPPTTTKKPTGPTLSVKKEHAQKPHPMYVQMVLLRRTPSEKLQKQSDYLFGCVPGLHCLTRFVTVVHSSTPHLVAAGYTDCTRAWGTLAEAFKDATRSRPLSCLRH